MRRHWFHVTPAFSFPEQISSIAGATFSLALAFYVRGASVCNYPWRTINARPLSLSSLDWNTCTTTNSGTSLVEAAAGEGLRGSSSAPIILHASLALQRLQPINSNTALIGSNKYVQLLRILYLCTLVHSQKAHLHSLNASLTHVHTPTVEPGAVINAASIALPRLLTRKKN